MSHFSKQFDCVSKVFYLKPAQHNAATNATSPVNLLFMQFCNVRVYDYKFDV